MRYYIHFILSGLLLFFICTGVQAQEDKRSFVLTIEMQQVPLPEILKEIEKQCEIHFSYESSLLQDLPEVTLIAKEEPLESCLKRMFSSLPVLYQQKGTYIILKRKPKQVTISGFVFDKTSSESLIGASVYDIITFKGMASNNHGFFSIRLSPGEVSVYVSYIGYKSKLLHFDSLENDTLLTVELEPGTSLEEVIVSGTTDVEKHPLLSTRMGALELNQQTIQSVPVMFGESDIIKTLQMTPGVAVGTEGFAGMYVRGGNVDENLFLIDGNPIYQVNHVGGIFSAFNTEAVRGMEFLKAGFPSRYGGRLSSVVDVHTREGNMKEYHGQASIGLIAGNISLEGPIVKDRTSFMIALRRTWLDALSAPALAILNHKRKKKGEKLNLRYAFHDLNFKLDHRFNDKSRMFFSLYNGNDVLKGSYTEFSTKDEEVYYYDDSQSYLRWGNLMATAGWTYVFNNQLFGKLSGVYTRYKSTVRQIYDNEYGIPQEDAYSSGYSEMSTKTGITDFGFRSLFDYMPSTFHRIRFGADMLIHRFKPECSRVKGVGELIGNTPIQGVVYANDLLWANEFSAFIEDDWNLSHTVRINGGVRYTLFTIDNKTYTSLEPRLSMRWLLNRSFSLKASYARMNQYVHLINNSFINLPTDAWMPITSQLKPLVSDQLSIGAYYNWKEEYNFSVEGYYKQMDNLLEYKNGYSFLPFLSSWEDKMATGEGCSYGAEFMLRKQTGKTTGWIGYTLSWSDRKFRDINNGLRFPAKYDNRHKLNLVAMHQLSSRVELSAMWTYTSGNRLTLALENYEGLLGKDSYYWNYGEVKQINGLMDLNYFEERNNYQLPAYHRLDLGINIYRPKKNGRMGIWNVSIYNAYCRMNPFMIRKSLKATRESEEYKPVPRFKQVGIMPIIPSVTYTYKF